MSVRAEHILTGIEEDHCLDTQILLVLQFQLSEPRGHGQEHIKDLQNSLYAFPLIPMETHLKRYTKSRIKELTQTDKSQSMKEAAKGLSISSLGEFKRLYHEI